MEGESGYKLEGIYGIIVPIYCTDQPYRAEQNAKRRWGGATTKPD
jgi:hypothetical protein